MDNFYHILVKDEDKNNDDLHLDLDQSRHAIEICNRFSKKSNYWLSYVIRSSAELVVALVLLVWVSAFGIPYLAGGENVWYEGVMPCNIYGHMYECSGHPTQVKKGVSKIQKNFTHIFTNILFLLVAVLPVHHDNGRGHLVVLCHAGRFQPCLDGSSKFGKAEQRYAQLSHLPEEK